MSKLGQTLSQYWSKIQGTLFPQLQEELDSLRACFQIKNSTLNIM